MSGYRFSNWSIMWGNIILSKLDWKGKGPQNYAEESNLGFLLCETCGKLTYRYKREWKNMECWPLLPGCGGQYQRCPASTEQVLGKTTSWVQYIILNFLLKERYIWIGNSSNWFILGVNWLSSEERFPLHSWNISWWNICLFSFLA